MAIIIIINNKYWLKKNDDWTFCRHGLLAIYALLVFYINNIVSYTLTFNLNLLSSSLFGIIYIPLICSKRNNNFNV